MTLSSFTGLPEIADNSDATPGLWNARYSIVSQNLDQLNSDASAVSTSASAISAYASQVSTYASEVSSRVSIFDSGISNRLTGWDRGSVSTTISANTINELATGGGVTIDGVDCIDSAITVDAIEVSNATIYARTTFTPSVGTASGSTGAICWDGSYIYVCVSTDSWSRATLNTF